jgi:LacI family transcriptional regulator
MNKYPKIMLDIRPDNALGRAIYRGITKYSNIYGPWDYNIPRNGFTRELMISVRHWEPDGFIAFQSNYLSEIISLGVPVVGSDYNKYVDGICTLRIENDSIASKSCEYFINNGFKHLAYCGYSDIEWTTDLFEKFKKSVNGHGLETPQKFDLAQSYYNMNWYEGLEKLIEWLRNLPKPCGLLACEDLYGKYLIRACRLSQIHVPEEIAVLSINDDETICDICNPPLSSIMLDGEAAGFKCAELLDKMLKTGHMSNDIIWIYPIKISSRQSTNILAIDDSEVAKAVAYIRNNSRNNIQVQDVVDAVTTSRRNLYERFKDTLGRTIHEEIKRVRVQTVANLLLDTDLTVSQIASLIGDHNDKHISRTFKSVYGMTPKQFRTNKGRSD